jgi:hypothetical protein
MTRMRVAFKVLGLLLSLSLNSRFMVAALATNRHQHPALAKDDFSLSSSASSEVNF